MHQTQGGYQYNPPTFESAPPQYEHEGHRYQAEQRHHREGKRAHFEHDEEAKFSEPVGYRDVWCLVLFVLHLLAFGALLGFGIVTRVTGIAKDDRDQGDDVLPQIVEDTSLFLKLLGIAGICVAIGSVLATVWLLLCQYFATMLIWAALFGTIGILAASGAYFLVMGWLIQGVLFLFFALIFSLFYFAWRSRIPFASAMLTTVSELVDRYPATVRAAYLALFVQMSWVAAWVIALGLVQNYPTAAAAFCTLFLIFSFYWTAQVIKNVLHVTVAGTFATWYFMSDAMPRNPTISSARRALTTSLGSIAFGSLIIAALQTLRAIVLSVRREANNVFVALLAMCADCILAVIDVLVQYFNLYAFAQVAIYGKSYIQAARDTWALVHSHGFEAIVNDNLIGNVLSIACLLSGIITAVVGGVVTYFVESSYWPHMAIICFLIGFVMVLLVLEIVESAVISIFVCFAEEPQVLRQTNPHLFQKFYDTYYERCPEFFSYA